MAAVAAEPGAAAAAPTTTTAGDGLEYEAEPGEHGAGGESHSKRDFVPETDLCHRQRHQQAPDAADAVEECGQVQMEIMRRRRRPELQAAGKAQPEDGHAAASGAWSRMASRDELALTDYKRTDVNAAADERLKEARSDAASQPGPHESEPNFSSVSISNSQPSVDFLYFPTIHPETLGTETETGTEANLTLSQPVLEFHREPESTCPNEIATDSLGTNSEPGSVPVASELEPRDRPPESMCHNDMGIGGLETNSEPEPAPTVTSESNPHDRPPEPTRPSDLETNSEPVPVASDSEPNDPPPDSTYPSDLVTNSEPVPVTSESEPHNPPPESPPSSLEEETSLGESVGQSCMSDFSNTSSKDSAELPAESEPEDVHRHPVLPFKTDPSQAEAKTGPEPESESGSQSGFELESKPQVSCPETTVCCPQPVVMGGLVPGSEVRVSLDHIIDDALVVSFRLGEKIFSGVLMDLSKRFGPYGIPITVFPKREYKDKPESMQLKTEAFQSETEKGEGHGDSAPPKETAPEPQPHPWTSKPPPLFQEGAPYPPPLFIRDTYNQSLPQPLPRKIKRPKRRLYREEPTSILNAIKLRPRQVLCDKCKGAVAQGDRRDTRRGPVSDCRNDDAKRRRNSNDAVAGKRPRSEDRSRNVDAKRHATAIRVTHSASLSHSHAKGAAGHRVAKGVQPATPSSANSSARVGLGAKKVLQSKNVEHSKAREVLKKAQRRQRETVAASKNNNNNPKATTRAAALQEAHQKVHFTRRLQQISGGGAGAAGGGGAATSNPLPPRMRIKPQRYRNEENDSSLCKPPCLEKVPGGGRLALPKLAAARGSAARSSSSSSSASSSSSFSCSAAAATAAAAAESQGSERALKPALSQTQIQIQQPQPHSDPDPRHPEPEEREGRGSGGVGKAGNLVVYMTLNSSQPDSSSTSMCSVDSADDLKSSNSECSSTETLDFPPPGDFRSAPGPSSVSVSASASVSAFAPASASVAKEEKKRGKALKAAVFSKNVSKCVALDGRTICVGDIVWAKILGFPWWPARILAITVSRKDNGLLVRQEARVSWFGSPTTSFLAVTQLAPFLENFQLRFDKKRKGLYRKAITEAAKAAKQLTPEVRALLTQFET